jgi:hypothetical protein
MAEIKGTKKPLPEGPVAGYTVSWAGMGAGDTGDWVSYPHYPQKTVTIEGDPVKMWLEGRNLPDDAAIHTLVDERGIPITRPGIYRLTVNPLQLRPVVEAGEGVTVTILVSL